MGCQNAGLLGWWGNHASPPWLHTDLLLYQSNWTAADMGRNFLLGYTHVHFWLVQNTGLTHGPLFISNCLLQSQERGDFPCCGSSTGLLCAYAAPARRYLFLVQHPRDSLVSPALVSMPALSLSSSGQLSTCHRGYQQKWLRDDGKHHCCGRSHSKGGRHLWHHHPRTFKCWGDTGKHHPRGLQIAASHISGTWLHSHYSISLSSPAEKIPPTTL